MRFYVYYSLFVGIVQPLQLIILIVVNYIEFKIKIKISYKIYVYNNNTLNVYVLIYCLLTTNTLKILLKNY